MLWLARCESQMLGNTFLINFEEIVMAQRKFNFDKFNELTSSKNCGGALKGALAKNMFDDYAKYLEYFDNPYAESAHEIVKSMRQLIANVKRERKDATLIRQEANEIKTDERQGPSSENTMT